MIANHNTQNFFYYTRGKYVLFRNINNGSTVNVFVVLLNNIDCMCKTSTYFGLEIKLIFKCKTIEYICKYLYAFDNVAPESFDNLAPEEI